MKNFKKIGLIIGLAAMVCTASIQALSQKEFGKLQSDFNKLMKQSSISLADQEKAEAIIRKAQGSATFKAYAKGMQAQLDKKTIKLQEQYAQQRDQESGQREQELGQRGAAQQKILSELSQEKLALERENRELNSKITNLTGDVAGGKRLIEDQKQHINQLQQERDLAIKEKGDECYTRDEALRRLNNDLRIKQGEVDNTARQLRAANSEIEMLRIENQRVDQKLQSAERELDDEKHKFVAMSKTIGGLEESVMEQGKRIEAVEQNNRRLVTQRDEANQKAREAADETQRVKAALDAANEKIKEAGGQVAKVAPGAKDEDCAPERAALKIAYGQVNQFAQVQHVLLNAGFGSAVNPWAYSWKQVGESFMDPIIQGKPLAEKDAEYLAKNLSTGGPFTAPYNEGDADLGTCAEVRAALRIAQEQVNRFAQVTDMITKGGGLGTMSWQSGANKYMAPITNNQPWSNVKEKWTTTEGEKEVEHEAQYSPQEYVDTYGFKNFKKPYPDA